jgi:hypothetical protein
MERGDHSPRPTCGTITGVSELSDTLSGEPRPANPPPEYLHIFAIAKIRKCGEWLRPGSGGVSSSWAA